MKTAKNYPKDNAHIENPRIVGRGFTLAEGTPCSENLWRVGRKAFTLAEGTPCSENLWKVGRKAFTLAEVLITLAIIGVVAAMTIPTLWAKVGQKVSENQQKVFSAKLIKALNLAKTSGDLNDKYTSTEDFLKNGLAKHYKMSAICGTEKLRDCIPYDTIKYMDGEEEKTVNVADLKTAKSIKLDEPFEDTAAFVTADGIPVIISYDKTCTVDTEKLDRGISSCVAGIYDLNGTKSPNKYGFTLNDDGETIKAYTNDLHAFNGAGIGKQNLFSFEIAKQMFKPVDIYESMGTPVYCYDVNIPQSCYYSDYWKAADLYCSNSGGKLPSIEQLAEVAQVLYDDTAIKINDNESYENGRWNKNKVAVFATLGIPENEESIFIMTNADNGNTYTARGFDNKTTAFVTNVSKDFNSYALMTFCVKN